jgi:hypothetical protein
LIYADLNGNAVFKRDKGGAYVTSLDETGFTRTLGGPRCGAFEILGSSQPETQVVHIVRWPIDALALSLCIPNSSVFAIGDDTTQFETLRQRFPDPITVFASFNNDKDGDRLARLAFKNIGALRGMPIHDSESWVEAMRVEMDDTRRDIPRG